MHGLPLFLLLKTKGKIMSSVISPLITQGSGKVGNIVITKSRSSKLVLRTRTVPTNPNTSYQQYVRSAFAWAVNAWTNLSDNVADQWIAYAKTVWHTGPMGESYNPAPKDLFIAFFSLWQSMYTRGFVPVPPNTSAVFPGTSGIAIQPTISVIPIGGAGNTGCTVLIPNDTGSQLDVIVDYTDEFGARQYSLRKKYNPANTHYEAVTDETSMSYDILGSEAGKRIGIRVRCFYKNVMSADMGKVCNVFETVATLNTVPV